MKHILGVEITGELAGTVDINLGNRESDGEDYDVVDEFGWQVVDGEVILEMVSTNGMVSFNDDADDFIEEVTIELDEYLTENGCYNTQEAYNEKR